jgi:hypothetical protein
MQATKDNRLSHEYTTAGFRRNMTDVFEAARYRDAVINVSHHGKPWVSVVSPEIANHILTMRELGDIEPGEIKAAVSSLESPIGIEELVLRILQRRTGS